MKITAKAANIYGYIAIAMMAVLLVLVILKLVPPYLNWWLFSVALALYLVRITLRLMLARQARLEEQEKAPKEGGQAGKTPND